MIIEFYFQTTNREVGFFVYKCREPKHEIRRYINLHALYVRKKIVTCSTVCTEYFGETLPRPSRIAAEFPLIDRILELAVGGVLVLSVLVWFQPRR